MAEGLNYMCAEKKGAACWWRSKGKYAQVREGAEKEMVLKLPCQALAQGCWWQQVQKPQPHIAGVCRSARSVHNTATNDHDKSVICNNNCNEPPNQEEQTVCQGETGVTTGGESGQFYTNSTDLVFPRSCKEADVRTCEGVAVSASSSSSQEAESLR